MNCEKPLNGKLSATLKIRGGVKWTVWARKPERVR